MVKFKYIIQAITKSYSHKPHLQDLPYDLRSNNIDELQERLDVINEKIDEETEYIKKQEKNNLQLNKEIQSINKETDKLEEENLKYEKIQRNIDAHYNLVEKSSWKDGNEIRKKYIKLKETAKDADFSKIDNPIDTFLFDITREGYLPVNYTDINTGPLKSVNYTNDRLNPLIENIRKINTPEAKELATSLEEYREKYNPQGNNQFTEKLKEIEEIDNEKWYMTYDNNITKIGENNLSVNEKVLEIKSNAKNIKLAEGRKKDYKGQKKRTEQRINEIKNNP